MTPRGTQTSTSAFGIVSNTQLATGAFLGRESGRDRGHLARSESLL